MMRTTVTMITSIEPPPKIMKSIPQQNNVNLFYKGPHAVLEESVCQTHAYESAVTGKLHRQMKRFLRGGYPIVCQQYVMLKSSEVMNR